MDNLYGVTHFYSLSEIKESLSIFEGRLPDGFIIIAELEGGDQLCIFLNPKMNGVYAWNHEYEVEYADIAPLLSQVAQTFSEFLDLIHDPDPLDEAQFEVMDVRISDPILWKKLQEETNQEYEDIEKNGLEVNSGLIK